MSDRSKLEIKFSFQIYYCVYLGRNLFDEFDTFFPIIIYEWRDHHGWSLEERLRFKESHDCFAKYQHGQLSHSDILYVLHSIYSWALSNNVLFRHIEQDLYFLGCLRDTCVKVIKRSKSLKHTLIDLCTFFGKAWRSLNILPVLHEERKVIKRYFELIG